MSPWVRFATVAGGLLLASSCVPLARGESLAQAASPLPPGPPRRASARPASVTRLAFDLSGLLALDTGASAGTHLIVPPPFRFAANDAGGYRKALSCLTAAVYYEARSEGPAGEKAVAQVVLNRVRHFAYPATVCGVVYQGAARRTGCQFSFACDGSRGKRVEPAAWRQAEGVARAALDGSVYAPVGWATHYHRFDVSPAWSGRMRGIIQLGDHLFMRWPGAAGSEAAFVRRFGFRDPGRPAPRPASCLTPCQKAAPSSKGAA